MSRLRSVLAAAGAIVSMVPRQAAAQPQHIALPPVNLGQTSFMDGLGGPGLMTRVPVDLYNAPASPGRMASHCRGPTHWSR